MAQTLDRIDTELLERYQRGFPLVRYPYRTMAAALGVDEPRLLERLDRLLRDGVIGRIGPVLAPGVFGASTLAAMEVPAARLDAVAALVNGYAEVNHNYEREHAVNLWFVLSARSRQRIDSVLDEIGRRTGLAVLDLPLLKSYHIDLAFPLGSTAGIDTESGTRSGAGPRRIAQVSRPRICAPDRALAGAMEAGIACASRPFSLVAERVAMSEAEVIGRARALIASGAIKRFGLVVRHRELGYRANAMTVWDIPDRAVDATGTALARAPEVTLCYLRPRRPGSGPAAGTRHWPYNLYCMVHGRRRDRVSATLERLAEREGLERYPRAVLFSRRRFKQRGARYRAPGGAAVAEGRADG